MPRDYDDDSWRGHEIALAARGLLDDQGTLTPSGTDLKNHIESATDRLALRALDALDDDDVEKLFAALTPITRRVIAGGDIPALTPMGLSRDDLDDAGARS